VPDDEALGSEFVHILVPIPASDGNAEGVIIFTENITERNSQKNDAE
jgi:hypothetical protein